MGVRLELRLRPGQLHHAAGADADREQDLNYPNNHCHPPTADKGKASSSTCDPVDRVIWLVSLRLAAGPWRAAPRRVTKCGHETSGGHTIRVEKNVRVDGAPA